MTDRGAEFKRLYCSKENPKTLREIGDMQVPPISRERVRQILKPHGITSADSGRMPREKVAPKQARVHDELWHKLRAFDKNWHKTPLAAYKQQVANAKKRGIEWELTLAEWWEIWEKSGKYGQRGSSDGQYVMCRIRDFGPYSRHSVRIKTCNENAQEQRDKRGKWYGRGHSQSDNIKQAFQVPDFTDDLD